MKEMIANLQAMKPDKHGRTPLLRLRSDAHDTEEERTQHVDAGMKYSLKSRFYVSFTIFLHSAVF